MTLRHSITCLVFAVTAAACGDDELTSGDTSRVDGAADVLFDDLGGADTNPTDTTPADTTPADTAVADTVRPDTTPADTAVADTAPADTTPADTAVADTTPADTAVADTAQPDVADTTPPDDTDVAADTSDVGTEVVTSCAYNGFTPVAQDGLAFATGDTYYLAQSTLGEPVDIFAIEIYAALGGATTPGVYEIMDENYDTCGNCVLVQKGCDAALNNCQATFLATAGTLTISSIGGVGAQFTATLSDLVLTEISYDGDYHSTPITGGDTWCIDSYEADVTLQ